MNLKSRFRVCVLLEYLFLSHNYWVLTSITPLQFLSHTAFPYRSYCDSLLTVEWGLKCELSDNAGTSAGSVTFFFLTLNLFLGTTGFIRTSISFIPHRQRASGNMDSHPRALGHASETFSETSQNFSKRHSDPVVPPSKWHFGHR